MSSFAACRHEDLVAAVEALERAGHRGQAQLFRAVLSREIALIWVSGRTAPLGDLTSPDGRPVVAAIGDDDFHATGPGGWRCAGAAIGWARSVMVAAGKDKAEHYRALVEATKVTGRGLLIETDADHAVAWASLLGDKAAVIVLPPPLMAPVRRETVH